nr:DUF5348 domain-containing protein [uncultured Metabacillus sp.]
MYFSLQLSALFACKKHWVVFWGDNTGYKVRCGDWLDLHLGDGRKLSCRMELGRDWYIIVGRNDTKFYLKPNETYQVNI